MKRFFILAALGALALGWLVAAAPAHAAETTPVTTLDPQDAAILKQGLDVLEQTLAILELRIRSGAVKDVAAVRATLGSLERGLRQLDSTLAALRPSQPIAQETREPTVALLSPQGEVVVETGATEPGAVPVEPGESEPALVAAEGPRSEDQAAAVGSSRRLPGWAPGAALAAVLIAFFLTRRRKFKPSVATTAPSEGPPTPELPIARQGTPDISTGPEPWSDESPIY